MLLVIIDFQLFSEQHGQSTRSSRSCSSSPGCTPGCSINKSRPSCGSGCIGWILCADPSNNTGPSISHSNGASHNASAVGQLLANPTPLPPLHSGAHHHIGGHHSSHHLYYPGGPNPPESNICNNSAGMPPTSASTDTALSSLA